MTEEAIRVEAEGEARPAPREPEDAARAAERYREAVLRALAAALRPASPLDNAEATEDVAGRGPHPVVRLARVTMCGAHSIRAGTTLSTSARSVRTARVGCLPSQPLRRGAGLRPGRAVRRRDHARGTPG